MGENYADRRAVDRHKSFPAIAVHADHRAKLVRSDHQLLRTDLDPVIGQSTAILAAHHHAFEHIIGAFGKSIGAEFDFGRADDDLASVACNCTARRGGDEIGAVELRNMKFPPAKPLEELASCVPLDFMSRLGELLQSTTLGAEPLLAILPQNARKANSRSNLPNNGNV